MTDHDDLIGENTWQLPFYRCLHENLPLHRSNYAPQILLNMSKLSEDLSISKQACYAWVDRNAFPPNRLLHLLDLPGSTLTFEKLRPFGAWKKKKR